MRLEIKPVISRQTGRQTDRQTDRHTGRQTDRHTCSCHHQQFVACRRLTTMTGEDDDLCRQLLVLRSYTLQSGMSELPVAAHHTRLETS